MVITTFTNKATQEVKERLLVEALKQSNNAVFEYINKKSFVQISTIHGLLHLFVVQNTEALSLPHDLKIVDQAQADKNLKKIIYQLMKSNVEYTELLESYAFQKLLDVLKQALNLKYQNSNLSAVSPELLLKVYQDKKNRILQKLNDLFALVPEVPEKWQGYFGFLKEYAQIVKSDQVEKAIEFFEYEFKKPPFQKKNPPFQQEAHDLIEEIRESDLFIFQDTSEYHKQHDKLNQLFLKFVEAVFNLLIQFKQRTGELTTDDLENYSLMLINDFPEAALEFSKSWDYFMIDEYQDTSPLQVKILNRIVGEQACFIVGDPQQSIYLFRGARSEVFNEKEAEYLKRNLPLKVLNTNYRSEPALMSYMNDFFNQFTQTFKPMLLKDKKSETLLKDQVFTIRTHDEALATLKQIQYLISHGVQPKDICVLSRKNSSLVQIAQLAFRNHIPVQLQASSGFESKREILDLVAFLKFLVNPSDSENLVTLLRSPWVFVEDDKLVELCQSKEAQFSLWSALLVKATEPVIRLQNYLLDFQTRGASLTLKKFMMETGFIACSELLDPTGKREANIWKLLSQLSAQESKNGFSLSLFLQEQFQSLQSDLSSLSREAQPVIQPDRVSFMTVHASKGLEFKNVIVIGFTDMPQTTKAINLAFDSKSACFSLSVFGVEESKLMPSAWSTLVRKEFNQRELLESERVLYVAMTRAQETISLIAELPRPTARQTIASDSWYKKIAWSEESYANEKYSLKSEFFDDEFTPLAKSSKENFEIRPAFSISEVEQKDLKSVTDILSEKIQSSEQKINFEKKFISLKKAQRGTDLHRLFESLKYLDIKTLNDSISSEDQKLIQYLTEQKEVSLKEILAKGHNEWGFGLKYKKGILQGQIDAWAELDHEIHILDYKTGSAEYSQKAFDQLTIYTLALLQMKQISKNKKIVQSVIYPVDRQIIKREFTNAEELFKKEVVICEMFF